MSEDNPFVIFIAFSGMLFLIFLIFQGAYSMSTENLNLKDWKCTSVTLVGAEMPRKEVCTQWTSSKSFQGGE